MSFYRNHNKLTSEFVKIKLLVNKIASNQSNTDDKEKECIEKEIKIISKIK